MSSASPIVLVEVVYRDADNYKESTTLAFPGTLTEELRSRLRFALDSEQYYLPTQIQHEHLGTRMESWPDAPVRPRLARAGRGRDRAGQCL
jgi:hypothetical protein